MALADRMTYNFDPDVWYENHRLVLERRHADGDLDDASFAAAIDDLDRRFGELVTRLDGTYEILEAAQPAADDRSELKPGHG